MIKDIESRNEYGACHGYCAFYFDNGNLDCKGVFVNGLRHGYIEYGDNYGRTRKEYTGYCLDGDKISKDNAEGNCYIWNRVEV